MMGMMFDPVSTWGNGMGGLDIFTFMFDFMRRMMGFMWEWAGI